MDANSSISSFNFLSFFLAHEKYVRFNLYTDTPDISFTKSQKYNYASHSQFTVYITFSQFTHIPSSHNTPTSSKTSKFNI